MRSVPAHHLCPGVRRCHVSNVVFGVLKMNGMYMLSVLNFEEMGALIRRRSLSLNNSEVFFGPHSDFIGTFLRHKLGSAGYTLGVCGPLSEVAIDTIRTVVPSVAHPGHLILETMADCDDAIRFRQCDIISVSQSLKYGLEKDEVLEQLAEAEVPHGTPADQAIEVICVPAIRLIMPARATSLSEELDFAVDGITFVRSICYAPV